MTEVKQQLADNYDEFLVLKCKTRQMDLFIDVKNQILSDVRI